MKFLFAIIFSVLSFSLLAQGLDQYSLVKQLTTENGMPSNYVYSVIEDSNGFMWFATDQGVVKYDGEKLKVFTTEDGLPTNDIFDLREDKWGRIWMFCKCENISYIREDQVFNTVSSRDDFYFYDFEEDEHGIIVHGLHPLTLESNDTLKYYKSTFVGKNIEPLDIGNRSLTLIKTNSTNDTLYVHYLSQGDSVISTKVQISNFYHFTSRFYFDSDDYMASFNTNQEYILLVNKKTGLQRKISIKNQPEFRFLPTKLRYQNGIFTLVKGGRFYSLEPKSIKLDSIKFEPTEYCTLPTSFLRRGEIMIFTSLDNGVFVLKKNNNIESSNSSIAQSSRYQITKDTQLIIGDQSGQVSILGQKLNSKLILPSPTASYNSNIRFLHIYKQKELWSYSHSDFFQVISLNLSRNPKVETLQRYDAQKYKHTHNDIYAFSDSILITMNASSFGIITISEDKTLDYKYNSTKGFNDIMFYSGDTIVLGGNKSFSLYCLNTEDFLSTFTVKYNIKKILNSEKGLFFGTDGQGVFKYDIETQTSNNILADKSVLDLKESEEHIIVSTTQGAYFLDNHPPFEIQKYYSKREGLFSNDVTFADHFNGKDMIITDQGIQLFDPDYSTSQPKIDLYIDHPDLLYNDTLTLDQRRDLSFSISKKDYLDYPIDYYYSFSKGQDNYSLAGTDNLTLTNLAPGKYKLKVYGVNTDYNFTSDTLTKTIIIKPRFYETLLFKVVALLALLALVYTLFRLRFKSLQQKAEAELLLEKEYAGIELQALQSQMNPHFVFNCLNSIQALINANKKQEANAYLVKFSRLMRSFLEQSSSNVTTLRKEIEINRNYLDLEKLRFKNKLTYDINIDSDLQNQDIQIPAVIVQPFVENAIRHGIFHKKDSGHIEINIKEGSKGLEIEILDNGVGIDESSKWNETSRLNHVSKGTSIIKRKAELIKIAEDINLDISITDRKSIDGENGTMVRIMIPQD